MNPTFLSRRALLSSVVAVILFGAQAQGPWTTEKLAPDDSSLFQQFGAATAVDGDVAVVGAPSDVTHGWYNAGSAYVFARTASGWSQQARLEPSDPCEFGQFGYSVAVDGDTLAVGARYDRANTGAVYVFIRTGAGWIQQAKLVPSNASGTPEFGCAVAVEGDTLLVGAPADPEAGLNAGAAYVFVRVGTSWTQEAKLSPAPPAEGDTFGFALALSGDTVAVGSPHDDEAGADAGSVQIFTRAGQTWSHQASLAGAETGANALLGWSVALEADSVFAGAPARSQGGEWSGAACLFTRSNGTWSLHGLMTAEAPQEYEFFGWSVGLRNGRAVAGASSAANPPLFQAGIAHVFEWSGTTWVRAAAVRPSDNAEGDQFGYSVALSESTLLVGAPYQDLGWGFDNGAAYAFELPPISQPNHPPLADGSATSAQVPSENRVNASVTLDGSRSSDQDGDPLSFHWSKDGTSLGAGERLVVNLPVGTHLVTLEVTDGTDSASTVVTVCVFPVNHPPVADAGATPPQVPAEAEHGARVTLDGRRSSDPDGDPLSYEWLEGDRSIAQGPLVSVALTVGSHELALVVSDGSLQATTQFTVTVVAGNHPPVAEAGPQGLTVISPNNRFGRVTLDGGRSSDPDGDALSYAWLRESVLLADTARVKLTLRVGEHRLTLRVSDGQAAATDSVTVRVITASDATRSLMETLKDLDLPAWGEKPLLAVLRSARVAFDCGHSRYGAAQVRVFQWLVTHRDAAGMDPRAARLLVREAQKIVEAVAG